MEKDLKINVSVLDLENVKEAFRIANNAIYMASENENVSCLYHVCKLLNPEVPIGDFGKVYIYKNI